MPSGFQLSRSKGWRMPAGGISVARPSRWGNPFVVGHGDVRWSGESFGDVGAYNGDVVLLSDLSLTRGLTVDEAVQLYAEGWRSLIETATDPKVHPDDRSYAAERVADLETLRGHDLGCWCSLDGPCHRNVLLELANR